MKTTKVRIVSNTGQGVCLRVEENPNRIRYMEKFKCIILKLNDTYETIPWRL